MASAFVRPATAQTYRPFGAGALVVDDNHHHTLTLQTPQPGDPGYSAWATAGQLSWRLPIPPVDGANMGFILPGPATPGPGQMLLWDRPVSAGGTGGSQGVWRSTSIATVLSSFGVVTNVGPVGQGIGTESLAGWTSPTTIGIVDLTGDVTTSGGLATMIANNVTAGSHIIAALSTNGGTLTNNTSGNASGFTGSLAGDVTGTQGATVVSHVSAGALPGTVTVQGNTFNGANQLVLLDGSGNLPALDGSALTNITTTNFSGNLAGDVTGTQGATSIATNAAAGGHIVSAINSNASTGTINVANGGTGNNTYATGDILYASSPTTLSRLPAGGMNQVLGVSGGTPTWITNGATVTNTTNTPASLTVSTNDYTIDPSSTYIRLSNISGGPLDITGINSTGVSDGREITLVNTSANAIVIKHQSPSSAPNDQFDLPGGSDIILGQKGSATFIYDVALHYWELLATN